MEGGGSDRGRREKQRDTYEREKMIGREIGGKKEKM